MSVAPTDSTLLTGDDAIVREALENWQACKEWQGTEDERAREDIKFANADSRNAWQWPEEIYAERTSDESNLPCITINNTRVHNDLIINALSKNGYGIKVRPTGGKASYKSAQVMQSLIRRIESQSRSSAQYRKVAEQQVDGGIGYILIETAYVSHRSFDQDIFLKASRDPTAVYLDPWIKEPDGLDANFGFVFERMPKKTFNKKYAKYKDKVGAQPIDSAFTAWLTDKEIMLAKYYRKKGTRDTLVAWKDESGAAVQKLKSEIVKQSGQELYEALIAQINAGDLDGRMREVTNDKVEWFLIAGDTIVDRGDWAGRYIPICRCVGRELVIDGTLDRKGHTRPLIDANRMLNYNASMAVEIVALQPKSAFMAPARAIEGQEQFKTMNILGYPVLLYNDLDEEATSPETQKIDAPQRLDPPKPSVAHEQGMQTAERHGMMISGQFQAQMGENDTQSAASGKAINERKEQGDTATYHFVEHRGDMLRAIGIQLIDLIPKIYDTQRALHIVDDDGDKRWIRIEPNQQEALEELQHEKEDEEAIHLAFNPSIGEYECVSDPGPDFATQRQEAWNAMTMLLQANSELATVGADLLFKFGDFPGAEELRERFRREIKANKPYLFDDNVDPALQSLQQQNQRLVALNTELMQKLAEKQLALKGRDERRDIEAHRADTERLKVQLDHITKMVLTPQQRAQMDHEIEQEFHQHVYGTIEQANQATIDQASAAGGDGDDAGGEGGGNGAAATPAGDGAQAPIDGARKAPDGHWYVPDPTRPGKHMLVIP